MAHIRYMANLPQSSNAANKNHKMALVEKLVLELSNPDLRENALVELSKMEDLIHNLGPLLWSSFGTIALLLLEITSIYRFLSPPNLSKEQSDRVFQVIVLLQKVASHPDTKMLFLHAGIPLYLYPFLNTTSKSRPFENLRIYSLAVMAVLVQVDDTDVIGFFLSTEIMPLCLRAMEIGSELSKTIATYIVRKILLDEVGLEYVRATADRYFAVCQVLRNMEASLVEQPSRRLRKLIGQCYHRLSNYPRLVK